MLEKILRAMALRAMIVVSLIVCSPALLAAAESTSASGMPSIEVKTSGMRHMPGFLPLHWDAKNGKLYLEIPQLNVDMLYFDSLPYGTGSNDLGLDRGQVSAAKLVRFERFGPKILLVRPNEYFRSSAQDPAEQLAVRQSFPESILGSFNVAAENSASEAAAVLVDATDFFLRDVHGVSEALGKQGVYKLDAARSAIAIDATKAFPKNTEVEAILTFASDAPIRGSFVADVTPDVHALTLREHQSFLELPAPGFAPRRFDPRAGYFPFAYRDYAAPLGAPLDQRFIVRHRLIKQDPTCAQACVPVRPIQYYVDRGAPEPIRSALVEGARWWDQAFQAAGWAPGTFRVDVLPEGADPMDARYNIIQWVHRFTRGWSYGHPVADPRTGEIIKGNVTLGSLRGRQDYLIAEALLSPYVTGKRITPENDPMLAMALARTRQLAAHETGHTLGLAHNFAASAFPHTPSESVSVMDYPHPWVTLDQNGVPDLSAAYAVNIGLWDKVAINYGYRQYSDRSLERAGLDAILSDATKSGLVYITDEDARPPGGAHPFAHLWDNGSNAADELTRIMKIRSAALARFGENAIPEASPLATLEDTLVPLYLMHRYQTEAAIKMIGGLDYRYQLRGDGQLNAAIVSPDEQRKALHAVLKTLSAESLTLPESLLRLFPPRPPDFERTRESLPAHTGLTFDPIAAAESAADLTLGVLFDRERAARLVEYHARANTPSLADVIDAALKVSQPGPRPVPGNPESLGAAVQAAVYTRTVEALLTLAADPKTSVEVRAITYAKLEDLRRRSDANSPLEAYLIHRIKQFQDDPAKFAPAKPIEAPPGMPIGDDED
ncbi:MAG TPA: zinc-dependent metalloprotease [Steroidobacteraceae bacterium]|nr:zinc-dependent metalloprotease [Steroidobacteraceae bacterium]